MEHEHQKSHLQEHEKFWAFILLIAAILFLAWLGRADDGASPHGLTTRDAMVGLISIAGMAAQALFRVSSTDRLIAETAATNAQTAKTSAEKIPPITGDAKESAEHTAASDLPPMLREEANVRAPQ